MLKNAKNVAHYQEIMIGGCFFIMRLIKTINYSICNSYCFFVKSNRKYKYTIYNFV